MANFKEERIKLLNAKLNKLKLATKNKSRTTTWMTK